MISQCVDSTDLSFWDDVAAVRLEHSFQQLDRFGLEDFKTLMRDTVLLRLRYAVSEEAVNRAASLVQMTLAAAQAAVTDAIAAEKDVQTARAAAKRVFETVMSEYDAVTTTHKRRNWVRATFKPVV